MWGFSSARRQAMFTRRIATSSSSAFAILILILWVSQIWVCCHCQVRASRVFPPPPPPPHTADKSLTGEEKDNAKNELLQQYFNGRAFDRHRADEGFENSKRRIPSCPDPLHN
ncbi:unnamed protein product [Citrullus colocynthis]|uniref:Uncharacterized protein n=1 Tax=Citrullus colocynthis TaxID=252529 RepID=A0ABP0YDX8_9ROSI